MSELKGIDYREIAREALAALRELYDEQVPYGPPMESRLAEWGAAMQGTKIVLDEYERLFEK